MRVQLHFDRGTLVATDVTEGEEIVARLLAWDDRTRAYRGRGAVYRDLVLALHQAGVAFRDRARKSNCF